MNALRFATRLAPRVAAKSAFINNATARINVPGQFSTSLLYPSLCSEEETQEEKKALLLLAFGQFVIRYLCWDEDQSLHDS
jgi:hypothetical protein